MGSLAAASGPDFTRGVSAGDIPVEGTLAGRVGDAPVLLSRLGGDLFAVSGACTHYGAALADGLLENGTVRCPLHHACFDLRTGAALRAPAFAALDRWRVERFGGRVFVRRKLGDEPRAKVDLTSDVRSIVGAGAAGFACAERLRALGYDGALTLVGADSDPPCDRPNLSKDYLAGTAPDEWIPLRGPDWYRESEIELRFPAEIIAIDREARAAVSRTGETFRFDRLLLAPGAEPVRLAAPGFDRDNVRVLRSLADARALIARLRPGMRVAVLGSSFIGLEAAAALRARGLAVDVISTDALPFGRLFGPEIGAFFRDLHEANGVRFHFGRTAAAFDGGALRLDADGEVATDLVLLGIGVRPRTALATAAGLAVRNGIVVDEFLETPVPRIFAAGDAAAYPDPVSGQPGRVEHWVHAQRMGQAAAANMLGARERFAAVPFFWTEQYRAALRYVGRAERWDEVRIEGSIAERAFVARYYEKGALRASAAIGRDRDCLDDERRLERIAAEGAAAEPAAAMESAGGMHGLSGA